MVWVKNVGMRSAFICDACGFGYRSPKDAFECESACRAGAQSTVREKSCYKP